MSLLFSYVIVSPSANSVSSLFKTWPEFTATASLRHYPQSPGSLKILLPDLFPPLLPLLVS
jgi:hypothetical protein